MHSSNRRVRVLSLTNQTLIADKCVEANSFLSRLKGLIGRKKLEPGEGMLFPKCNDIHMWFMSVPLDVLFLARESASGSEQGSDGSVYRVQSIRRGARPWRPLPLIDWRADDTLELPAGTIDRCRIAEGDRLCIG